MPFNGSGTYTLPAGNPVVTGTTISSTTTNNTNSDIATALTNCVTRDGQSTPSADLPMNSHKLTGLSAGTSNGDSVRYEQLTAKQDTLVSGTNIKTVGGYSVLGSGNVPVQAELVSGTNIKTVNGVSLLGSGDLAAGANLPRSTRTSNTILSSSDKGYLIDITSGTFTQTLTAAATLGNGWFCYVKNSGTGFVTLDPNGSETINVRNNSLATWVLWPKESGLLVCDGTGFQYLRITPGEIITTISSGVLGVSFSTGLAYRRRYRLIIENLIANGNNYMYLKLNTSTQATLCTGIINNNGAVAVGQTGDAFCRIPATNNLSATSGEFLHAAIEFNVETNTRIQITTQSKIGGNNYYTTSSAYWSGVSESSISSVDLYTQDGTTNLTGGVITLQEV